MTGLNKKLGEIRNLPYAEANREYDKLLEQIRRKKEAAIVIVIISFLVFIIATIISGS
jgi:hypothetical protein